MIGAKLPTIPTKPEPDKAKNVVVIVAGPQKKTLSRTAQEMKDKGYARKSDFLRAQFLPEVEALDFSGLFVGEFGLGIRRDQERKNVVLADPSRITEVLLQGNAYRRSGNHVKALTAYQELVDIDPSNADFRFLMGKTLMELGRGEDAMEALSRARELGHEGARKEMETLKAQGHRPRKPLGFLRFWKQ
jgi:tetratricopeptide (TPR) repeat protein